MSAHQWWIMPNCGDHGIGIPTPDCGDDGIGIPVPDCAPLDTETAMGLEARILRALRAGPMSRADIARETGASKGRILRAVKLARGEGAIRPLGRGVWEVAS